MLYPPLRHAYRRRMASGKKWTRDELREIRDRYRVKLREITQGARHGR